MANITLICLVYMLVSCSMSGIVLGSANILMPILFQTCTVTVTY